MFAAASEVALRFFFFFGLFRFFFVLSPGEAVWAPGPPAAGGGPSRFSKGMLNATDVFGNGRTRVGVEGFGVDTDTPNDVSFVGDAIAEFAASVMLSDTFVLRCISWLEGVRGGDKGAMFVVPA